MSVFGFLDIPGYYYDESKRKYFRIPQKTHGFPHPYSKEQIRKKLETSLSSGTTSFIPNNIKVKRIPFFLLGRGSLTERIILILNSRISFFFLGYHRFTLEIC